MHRKNLVMTKAVATALVAAMVVGTTANAAPSVAYAEEVTTETTDSEEVPGTEPEPTVDEVANNILNTNQNLNDAADIITQGTTDVNNALEEGVNAKEETVNTAAGNATAEKNTASSEASNAANAKNEADEAWNSSQAKDASDNAEKAAQNAQTAADNAQKEADAAQKAYEEALKAYEEALAAAQKAEEEANAKYDAAADDMTAKVEDTENQIDAAGEQTAAANQQKADADKAEADAEAKEQEVIGSYEGGSLEEVTNNATTDADAAQGVIDSYDGKTSEEAKAEKEAAEKEAEDAAAKEAEVKENSEKLQDAADKVVDASQVAVDKTTEELGTANDKLAEDKQAAADAAAKAEEDANKVLEETEDTVKTGAELAGAEIYEAGANLAVDGLEATMKGMEEAKDLAGKAMKEATDKMNSIDGDKEVAQAEYDAALKAYNEADAALKAAQAELDAATAVKKEADDLAATDYGQKITELEKEITEATNETVKAEKQEELIETILKYDATSEGAKFETVESVDAENKIYETTDAEGNKQYYQWVENADGTYSFYECNKNETGTTVTKRENVTKLPSFEGMNEWEYDVTDLGNGSYEVVYYDVKDAESTYTSEEAAKEAVADDKNKSIYEYKVDKTPTTSSKVEVPTEPSEPQEPAKDLAAYLAEKGITEPKREDYWTDWGYKKALEAYNWSVNEAAVIYEEHVYAPLYEAYKKAAAEYPDKKKAYDDKVADANDRNADLLSCMNNGDTLTIVVNGEEKTLCYNEEHGFYYEGMNFVEGLFFDINNYDVTVSGTETNYRVVEYNETIKVDYKKVDNEADDSYENITNKVNKANEKFTAAETDVNNKSGEMQVAVEKEAETAAELADATKKSEDAHKVYDEVAKVYDYYYANDEMNYEIPESVAKVLNRLGITDAENIVNALDKFGVLDQWGIDADEVNITLAPDGQLTIEVPNSSKYDQHMVLLNIAKVAAEEEVKKAEALVEEKSEAHNAAVDELEAAATQSVQSAEELAKAVAKAGLSAAEVEALEAKLALAESLRDTNAAAAQKLAEEIAKTIEAAEANTKTANEKKDAATTDYNNIKDAEGKKATADAVLQAAQEAQDALDAAAKDQEAADKAVADAVTATKNAELANQAAVNAQNKVNELQGSASVSNKELAEALAMLEILKQAADNADAAAQAAKAQAAKAQAAYEASQARVRVLQNYEFEMYNLYMEELARQAEAEAAALATIEDEEVPLASMSSADGRVVKTVDEVDYVYNVDDAIVANEFTVFVDEENEDAFYMIFTDAEGKVVKEHFVVEHEDGTFEILTLEELLAVENLDLEEVFVYWAGKDGVIFMNKEFELETETEKVKFNANEDGVIVSITK